jgi:5-methylcytosine-specific restriction endonuclease McrA
MAGPDSDDSTENNLGDEYPGNWENFRLKVYQRDNYQCQNCGLSGGPNGEIELHAHHIVPLSVGGNNTLSNIVTLCHHCHILIHDHMEC